MFLEDEMEYVRLKRSDNIMGWLAIFFVAALVFMFAGIMNSASATGANAHIVQRTETTSAVQALSMPFARQASMHAEEPIIVAMEYPKTAPETTTVSNGSAGDVQLLALAMPDDAARRDHPRVATLADHDIQTGFLLISLALIGGSFVMLTFGGPRGGIREDKDSIDAL